jgi:hypothetical protein
MVSALRMSDLGVKGYCPGPGRTANSKSLKRDASDRHPSKVIESREQRNQFRGFRQRFTERVADQR